MQMQMQMQISLSLSSHSFHPKPLFPNSRPLFSSSKKPPFTVSAAVASPQDQALSPTTMYNLLSVKETAGPAEIKAAYRRQAQRWHPDTCPSSGDKNLFTQQFIRVREAYEILSDPSLREDYDFAISGKGKGKGRNQAGFGDWEAQLQSLMKRRWSSRAYVDTWGNRMRRAHYCEV